MTEDFWLINSNLSRVKRFSKKWLTILDEYTENKLFLVLPKQNGAEYNPRFVIVGKLINKKGAIWNHSNNYSAVSNCRTGTPLFLGIKFQVLRPYLMVVRLTKIRW